MTATQSVWTAEREGEGVTTSSRPPAWVTYARYYSLEVVWCVSFLYAVLLLVVIRGSSYPTSPTFPYSEGGPVSLTQPGDEKSGDSRSFSREQFRQYTSVVVGETGIKLAFTYGIKSRQSSSRLGCAQAVPVAGYVWNREPRTRIPGQGVCVRGQIAEPSIGTDSGSSFRFDGVGHKSTVSLGPRRLHGPKIGRHTPRCDTSHETENTIRPPE